MNGWMGKRWNKKQNWEWKWKQGIKNKEWKKESEQGLGDGEMLMMGQ